MAKINKRIEIAKYEKSIQTGFREVAHALAGRTTYTREFTAQEALVAAQQRRYDLTATRYRSGADSYLAVLLAQQDLYAAQRDLVSTRADRLANLITLYKSLGGGWRCFGAQPCAAVGAAFGRCAVQYSWPSLATRNSSSGAVVSVFPQTSQRCSAKSSGSAASFSKRWRRAAT